ncbi:hypothetical protein ABBQ32_001775 [Trebouxia sp. C0010 RCD-2024]
MLLSVDTRSFMRSMMCSLQRQKTTLSARLQCSSSKEPPLRASQVSLLPADMQQRRALFAPTHQGPIAHQWQSSRVVHLPESTTLPAMHPAPKAPVRVLGSTRKVEGSVESHSTARPADCFRAVSAAEKGSSLKACPLKGLNAWPPPSPSPSKGMPGRSQNRAPVRGCGKPVPAVLQHSQPDPLALQQRFR